jgi:hypothetical protein
MRSSRAAPAGIFLALTLSAMASLANPVEYYVLSPTVETGERDIELKLASVKHRDGSRESGAALSTGWSLTEHWATEVNLKWLRDATAGSRYDSFEWENRWQLTETGEYPVDLGWVAELEWPRDRSEGKELRWGPLLRADFSTSLQGSLNLLFGRHFGAATPSAWNLDYQGQIIWRSAGAIDAGVQGFGSVGRATHWLPTAQQTHLVGPALFGRVKTASHTEIKWNFGALAGIGSGSPRSLIRSQIEVGF